DLEDFRAVQLRGDVFVAGHHLVHQTQLPGSGAQPDLTGGDGIDIQSPAVLANKVLEQVVNLLQVVDKFLPPLVGVLPQHGQGALVLTGGEHLEVHVVLLEEAVKVGHLCQYADGTDIGKGGGENSVGDAGHHIAATGRHLVHAYGEGDSGGAQPVELAAG